MIKVSHLKKSVDGNKKQVLRDINTEFAQGEMVGIVGASGSGKSMLLRCLALRETWNSGDYSWNEDKLIQGGGKGTHKFRSRFAYLEQNPTLYPERTALKNVLIGQVGQVSAIRRFTGMVRSDDYMGAMDELEKFGLLDKAHVKAGKLSGGEKQRVAICRALVHGAKFVAADEPTIGLDPKSAERVIETFSQLCKTQGTTVVTALPLEFAEKYCTRILGIHSGEIKVDIVGRRLTAEEKRLIDLA
ncbi:ATP-binding cassette domain-containing protein [Paenibacillus sp. D2_2]|jgi:phosphonate transport system ATP-binding protein|uniref:phosphonate ABC transporter ATP-binding protein n=1 Tax=Paenibacillus sp. D2_2 TaxID=3073092 RepID=UPI0028155E7C|nr:ATP-binding cassette domain-containing protein [Paenibacillus sp. D2_2]WMT42956.1 ATP-binding cassette domain-containing protein [Paenibacillus sp. D2_2]